nr:sigma-70 factor domain-containing protein [Synergistales bacterium]
MARGKNDTNRESGDKALDYLENIRSIIHQGREKGFISVQDIENHIPIELWEPQILETIYTNLEQLDIDVIDTREEEEKEEALPESESLVEEDLELGKLEDVSITDHVRMYLKEIGKTPLLKAAEEIELAKRVEQGDEAAKEQLIK